MNGSDPCLNGVTVSERGWQCIIIALSAFVLLLTVWCLSHTITIIFMHLYYFPIVLLAYRYRWKGACLSALLALAYLGLVIFYNSGHADVIEGAVFRTLVFIGIALVIAWLSALIAERNRQLVEAREAAESADRLKSAFLATMSHELRTPLNSIIGFTGILEQELAGPLNEEQKKQLGMVSASADHLLALINDVLDLSKIEAGQMKVECEPFEIQPLLEKVIRTIRPMAARKGLPVSLEVGPGLGRVFADSRRVEQVLLNLLSNALKFTEKGELRISCSQQGSYVAISVTDTGIGIKPEDIKRLFRPFTQIDDSHTRQYQGTGLGLSISKRLVMLMGGSIVVESEWKKGSTFSFFLPVQQGE